MDLDDWLFFLSFELSLLAVSKPHQWKHGPEVEQMKTAPLPCRPTKFNSAKNKEGFLALSPRQVSFTLKAGRPQKCIKILSHPPIKRRTMHSIGHVEFCAKDIEILIPVALTQQ